MYVLPLNHNNACVKQDYFFAKEEMINSIELPCVRFSPPNIM